MNLPVFPVSTTNIFPIVNSTAGGQLATEWNLRSRESVSTDPSVKYWIGPSYTHSDTDYEVTLITDSVGTPISSTGIRIHPGRALVNGHYVESLADVDIDIAELNLKLNQESKPLLRGELTVGLRAMYSTQTTMVGSLLVENEASVYEGIQVVILPKTEFITPSDSPLDESAVTAHLKLADFTFYQGEIAQTSIHNDSNKTKVISADRIGDAQNLVDSSYVSKRGLDPTKIYTFAGYGSINNHDTWCDSIDSLMVWDHNPQLLTGTNPGLQEAQFAYDTVTGFTYLQMPHKQPDNMRNSSNESMYYKDKIIALPKAVFGTGVGGTVTPQYTAEIRAIADKINRFYTLPQGKLREYIEILESRNPLDKDVLDGLKLPIITATYNVGDYVVVNQDTTVELASDASRAPSTLYVVLPGYVQSISLAGSSQSSPYDLTEEEQESFGIVGGVMLGYYEDLETAYGGDDWPDPNSFWDVTLYRGQKGKDYFVAHVQIVDTEDPSIITTQYNYYTIDSTGPFDYSEPVWLTGEISLATETVVGGFLNVPENAIGAGYVYLTADGHLRLLDYDLLASGALAYQLGEDFTTSSGLSISGVQEELDEYVNNRVAFPNVNQQTNSETPDIINVTIQLAADTEETNTVLNIVNLDSRFNTSVCVHLVGSCSGYTINFLDCQKLRIDNQLTGSYTLNSYRCNLYYDPVVIDKLSTITDLSLWYERYTSSDMNIIVNDMSVELVGAPTSIAAEEYWSGDAPNDNHYSYALKGITFSKEGLICGCKLLVTDNITGNVQEGRFASVFQFKLPQSLGLSYPESKIVDPLKVTGQFITAYTNETLKPNYIMKSTSFTALSQYVTTELSSANATDLVEVEHNGMISFVTDIYELSSINGVASPTPIDSWQSGKFNQFSGGTFQ